MTLYARQQKRHRCKEQTFGLCGRRWGWDDLREQHWNVYIIMCETDDLSTFDSWNRALKAGALGRPRGMGWGWRRGSLGWRTHVHPWLIHGWNLYWSSSLHMVMYMFQCYFLISSHPQLIPLSPKVCSLHLCLLCCPACRIVSTIFLNSIYMCQYTVFVFLFLA